MVIDEDFAPDDQQEEIEDLNIKGQWFEDAVLWSVDWTTQTIISQLDRGNIDLNPSFQRRSAWTQQRKSLFVESLILGLPIPQIILAEDKKSRGRFIVIDGKQRLLSIRQFSTQANQQFEQLVLKGLQDRQDLNGETYESLKENVLLRKDLDRLENQTIRTVVIRGWKSEDYLYSVFLRINQGSVTLSPQELRQALKPGEFSKFIDKESADSKELQMALGLQTPDFRMRDAELLLRFFSYSYFVGEYNGNLKTFLDHAHVWFNKRWESEKDSLYYRLAELETALQCAREMFGPNEYLRKWNGSNFESRINRAVFDIMTFYLSAPRIRKLLENKGEELKLGFKRLCEDYRFRTAIELTTKSREANMTRFGMFAELLTQITSEKIDSPIT